MPPRHRCLCHISCGWDPQLLPGDWQSQEALQLASHRTSSCTKHCQQTISQILATHRLINICQQLCQTHALSKSMSTTDLADVARWETRKYLSLKNTLMQSVDTAYKVGLLQQQGSPKFSFALQECQHLVDVQAEDNLRQQPGTVYETFHILHQLLIGKLITQIHKNPSE